MSSANTVVYRHYNLPVFHPYLAFFGNHWILKKDAPSPRHFHNCIELGYCKSGSGTVHAENLSFSFQAGDYIVIPENISHHSVSHEPESRLEYVYFDPYIVLQDSISPSALEELHNGLSGRVGIIRKEEHAPLHLLAERIFDELHRRQDLYADALHGLLLSFCISLSNESSFAHSIKSELDWLYRSINYIHRNYHRKLSISEICNECTTLSESHFRKRFGEIMHISPLDYINHFRIRLACRSIYRGQKSINEIASDVGFPTLSTFNRNFTALLGCSPLQWKKKLTAQDSFAEIQSLTTDDTKDIFAL